MTLTLFPYAIDKPQPMVTADIKVYIGCCKGLNPGRIRSAPGALPAQARACAARPDPASAPGRRGSRRAGAGGAGDSTAARGWWWWQPLGLVAGAHCALLALLAVAAVAASLAVRGRKRRGRQTRPSELSGTPPPSYKVVARVRTLPVRMYPGSIRQTPFGTDGCTLLVRICPGGPRTLLGSAGCGYVSSAKILEKKKGNKNKRGISDGEKILYLSKVPSVFGSIAAQLVWVARHGQLAVRGSNLFEGCRGADAQVGVVVAGDRGHR